MTATTAPIAPVTALPLTLRSEAFVEDILEFVEPAQPLPGTSLRYLVNVAPLAVALLGLAFAVVPPLA